MTLAFPLRDGGADRAKTSGRRGLVISHPAPVSGPRQEIPSPSWTDQPGPQADLQHVRVQAMRPGRCAASR